MLFLLMFTNVNPVFVTVRGFFLYGTSKKPTKTQKKKKKKKEINRINETAAGISVGGMLCRGREGVGLCPISWAGCRM